jgi:hypothetical protein
LPGWRRRKRRGYWEMRGRREEENDVGSGQHVARKMSGRF